MAFCKNISTRSQSFKNTALRVFNERHLMLFVDLHLSTRSLILICKSYNSCFKMFLGVDVLKYSKVPGIRSRAAGRAGLKSGSARRYDVTGINGNAILVNSSVPQMKEFLRKLSAVWAPALKNGCQPCPKLKSLKNIGLKGCQMNGLPGAPTCLAPAPYATYFYHLRFVGRITYV
jgi:hypothetical protein